MICRFLQVSMSCLALGCATSPSRYDAPSLASTETAVVTVSPYAGTILEIHRIDGQEVGLTNHPSSNQWGSDELRVSPGPHTVELCSVARVGGFTSPARTTVTWSAQAGRVYEVVSTERGIELVATEPSESVSPAADIPAAPAPVTPAPTPPPVSWHELNERMVSLLNEGDNAKALDVGLDALRAAEEAFGPQHAAVATIRFNLGYTYEQLGRYAEGERLIQQALAIAQRSGAIDPVSRASFLYELANISRAQQRDEDAGALYEQVFGILERALGADHPDTIKAALALADSYRLRGQSSFALLLYRRVLAFQERTLKPRDPQRWPVLHAVAQLYHAQGQHDKAEPLYREAMRFVDRARPETAATLHDYARLLRDIGRPKQAVKWEAKVQRLASQ